MHMDILMNDVRRAVAIIPRSAIPAYANLLGALEEAYPVQFVGSRTGDIDTAAAAIVFPGGQRPESLPIPCLVLTAPGAESQRGLGFAVDIARCADIDRALHGQRLAEQHHGMPAALPLDGCLRVLASAGGKPVWVQSVAGGVHWSAASAVPPELSDREFLRDHMTPGRFWSLLPLAHFLKTICHRISNPYEPLRACFIIDDPNVRFSSYGYISYPALARDAREHGYHVSIATIPLDLVLPGQRATSVFRDNPKQLSLVVHGNDHIYRELGRRPERADLLARAALTRVGRFERRAGVRVERVMCPPHGACSAEMLGALFRYGFLGLAASRPFPWDGFADHRGWPLGGWLPAQMAGGGLPVIPRYPLSSSLDDLVFRALLGLPLVLYGHQSDLRDGLAPLRAAADRAAALGDVEWMSLAAIARGNAVVRERDGEARVTMYARVVRLPRPGSERVRIQVPRRFGATGSVLVTVDGETRVVAPAADGSAAATFARRGDGDLCIRIDPTETPPGATLADWRPRAWPLARRAMTEARDRAQPLLRRP